MNIQEAPHGINVVLETNDGRVVIGRFDSATPFSALLHDCDVHALAPGEDPEHYIRTTATYGVAVNQRDAEVPCGSIRRVRLLGEIAKLA
jgi:hypothetical protein